MKFDIIQYSEYGYTDRDSWDLKFNDEIILTKKNKERIIEVMKKVMEALL